MRIDPNTHVLQSFRNANPQFALLCGEAIDNSLDAGAKQVAIVFDPEGIDIKDDGAGITWDRYQSLCTIGAHGGMSTTALGRYGVGIKFQSMAAGPTLKVDSISVDGRLRGIIDWDEIMRKGVWETPDPSRSPALVGEPARTWITIGNPKKLPTPAAIEKIIQDAAKMFYPAIRDGVKIKIDTVPVPLLKEPAMTDIIDRTIHVSEQSAKYAHVRAGILIDPKSQLRQVHVSYRHRVIMPGTSFGCGDLPSGAIFCRVELQGPWQLAQFKNNITDDDRDELGDALLEVLRPLLEKSRSQKLSVNIEELTRSLNDMIVDELRPNRPAKKNPQGRQGLKLGKKGGTSKGKEEIKGPTKSRQKPRDTLQIEFSDGLFEEYGYGKFDETATPMRVYLAKDNPRIDKLINARDQEESKMSLYELALTIFLTGRSQKDFFDDKFGLTLWNLVSRQNNAAASDSADNAKASR